MRDFEHILAPVSLSEFLAGYYERRPLLVSRNLPHYYDDLISIDELNHYLGTSDVRAPGIRLIRSGGDLDPSAFTYSVPPYPASGDAIVDKEKLFRSFHDGYTILLVAHERHSRGVFHLRHLAERVFHAWVQVNIYLTPRESQGFRPHWDNHDVFVLQFEGSKEWSVYDRRTPPPSKRELWDGRWDAVDPTLRTTLQPGDLLYVPKGYVHEARSTDSLSGHITLGITPPTYADLLRSMLENIDEAEEFSDTLPFGFVDSGVDSSLFAGKVAAFFARLDISAATRHLAEQYRNGHLADAADRLRDYIRLPSLTDTTPLRKKASLPHDIDFSGGEVVLRFNQKTLRFPADAEAGIRHILAVDDFDLSSLPAMDESSKREMIVTLVQEGFLTIGP